MLGWRYTSAPGRRHARRLLRLCAGKIVTGSLQGKLRVFYPKEAEYSPDDLLLEEQLGAPILQVAIGRFVS